MTTALAPPRASRFVAIANGDYAGLPALPQAAADARALGDLLATRHGFESLVLADLPRGELLDAIDLHLPKGDAHDGDLILSWTGHGLIEGDTLRLMGRSGQGDVDVAPASILGEWAARTGARQVLVIVDTCFSGAAVVDALRLADAVNRGRRAPERMWFGVLAASQADEPSLSGALPRCLLELLRDGPRLPDFGWIRSRPAIHAHDFVQTVLREWRDERHRPRQISSGFSWALFRNPCHVAGLGDQPVEQLLAALHGGSADDDLFTGREDAIARIVAWMRQDAPGLFVVTGPPGCGKSALVGRIVGLASPAQRARIVGALASSNAGAGGITEEAGAAPDTAPDTALNTALDTALDPGEGSVDALLLARGATLDTAADELARQLGVEAAQGLHGVLAVARQRRREGRPLTIVVDGLDEARSNLADLVLSLLQPLAQDAQLIVATRDVPMQDRSLIGTLGGAGATLLDLGADAGRTQQDVRRYVLRRLDGVDPRMDASHVADVLAPSDQPLAGAPFLLARLITSQLREEPVDTGSEGWRLRLAATVESALERDVQNVVLEIDGAPRPNAARELLRALALAHGAGFPADDVWPAVATALSWEGIVYRREDAHALLGALGRHVIASSEGGQPVYRIAHQQLVDYLAADASRDPARPAGQDLPGAVAQAMAAAYERWLAAGGAAREHGYLWRFCWLHLAEAGEAGLEHLERLVERDREALRPDLILACQYIGDRAWNAADVATAMRMHTRAVELCRDLPDRRRLALALFHLSIVCATAGDGAGAEAAADEALSTARSMKDDPDSLEVLSSALHARAVSLIRDGRPGAARRLVDELLRLEPAGAGQALRLAMAHVVACQASAALGDVAEGLRHGEEAVALADRHGAGPNDHGEAVVLLEALSALSFVQSLQAERTAAAGRATRAPSDLSGGRRILAWYREHGLRHDLGDLLMAKGVYFLAQGLLLDAGRGVAPATPPDETPDEELDDTPLKLLDLAIELARPAAAQMVDAALLYGEAVRARAFAGGVQDAAIAVAALQQSIDTLQPFVEGSSLAAAMAGMLSSQIAGLRWGEVMHGGPAEAAVLAELQQQAIALLRRSEMPAFRLVLAGAIGQLAALKPQPDDQIALGAEAIEVLRVLSADQPNVEPQLLRLLIDQAARLTDERAGEAADAATEAIELAQALPPSPERELLLATARIRLATARMRMDVTDGARDMLADSIAVLVPASAAPAMAAVLMGANVCLAHIEAEAGRAEAALAAAREAATLIARPDLQGLPRTARLVVEIALGRALRAAGEVDEGSRTLRGVIATLASSWADGAQAMVLPLILALDVAAPDLWDASTAALGADGPMLRRLALRRMRPRAETAALVDGLVEALDEDDPASLRELRQIARAQQRRWPETFDAHWSTATGNVPPWLHLSAAVEWAVIAWLNTSTWTESKTYLEAHPLLLDADADIALDEFARSVADPAPIVRQAALLATARSDGIEAAYAPILRDIEIGEWLRSSAPEEHLASRPALLRPEVLASLRDREADDPRARVFVAVLALAQRKEEGVAFEALREPAAMEDRLRAASRSADAARLQALAAIVFAAAEDATVRRRAAAWLLVAQALLAQADAATGDARAALEAAPLSERTALAVTIVGVVEHHPGAAPALYALLPLLGPGPQYPAT